MGGGRGGVVVLKSHYHHPPLEFFALIGIMLLIGEFLFCNLESTWVYAPVLLMLSAYVLSILEVTYYLLFLLLLLFAKIILLHSKRDFFSSFPTKIEL